MNNLMSFKNEELSIGVRAIKSEDGSISINAEDTARGLGWSKVENKNGQKYISIRWERMNKYAKEFGFDHKWAKDDYIPESLLYLLAMKSDTPKAMDFQKWLAANVIPAIRKSGKYQLESRKQSSNLELLELQVKALREVESRVEKVNQKMDKKFDELPLFPADVKNLKKIVNKKVVPLLGGKKSNAYRPLSKKIFSDLYKQIFREFGVDASSEIRRKDFELAKDIIKSYTLPTVLKNEIENFNNQSQLNI